MRLSDAEARVGVYVVVCRLLCQFCNLNNHIHTHRHLISACDGVNQTNCWKFKADFQLEIAIFQFLRCRFSADSKHQILLKLKRMDFLTLTIGMSVTPWQFFVYSRPKCHMKPVQRFFFVLTTLVAILM